MKRLECFVASILQLFVSEHAALTSQEAIHATLVDDLRRAEPGANDREVAVECARCRRTDVDLVCYRTATRIEHAFLSENTLTELGKREFGTYDTLLSQTEAG
jgi:hypothetical protein